MEIALPFRLAPSGQVATVDSDQALISQHLMVIIATQLRERVMLADYGSPAESLVFSADLDEVGQELQALTSATLQTYAPDVQVMNIKTSTNQRGTVVLDIQYAFKTARQTTAPVQIYTATIEVGGKVDAA